MYLNLGSGIRPSADLREAVTRPIGTWMKLANVGSEQERVTAIPRQLGRRQAELRVMFIIFFRPGMVTWGRGPGERG